MAQIRELKIINAPLIDKKRMRTLEGKLDKIRKTNLTFQNTKEIDIMTINQIPPTINLVMIIKSSHILGDNPRRIHLIGVVI